MELRNDFRVGIPAAVAWKVFTDVERLAPCLPGAQLQEIEGDEYRGLVKVKVGPITAQYKGKAVMVEQDPAGGRLVLHASGRDTGGGGHANATITATLVPDGDGTRVTLVTDLVVAGRLAQFGRGVLGDVSTTLLAQFVTCLERTMGDLDEPAAESDAVSGAGAAEVPDVPAVRRVEGPDVAPVDLLGAAGPSLAKRALPALAALTGLIVAILAWRRRHR